jgi:transposase
MATTSQWCSSRSRIAVVRFELDPSHRTPRLRWTPSAREDDLRACPTPPEFRRRAVDLARLGEQPVAQIAKDLGISDSCLRNWKAQADADEGKYTESGRLSTDERTELAELRKKNKRLEVELEIVKRAAAYFAKENVLPK